MNDSTYHSLREQIEGLLTESRQQTRQAGEWEKVETYWQIGDALTAHIDTIPGSKHGQQIVRNLSKDLKLGYSTLYQILRLRRVIDDPKVYARTQMGWSHFRALIHLKTPEQICHYTKLANQENWTTRQLKRITFCLPGILKLPRFGGHFQFERKGVHNGKDTRGVSGGISPAIGRAFSIWPYTWRVGQGV